MKRLPHIILTICIFTAGSISTYLYAQTPTDLEFVSKGNICVGASYSYGSWKKYWEGDTLRENGNVGTVSTQMIGAGVNLGILDRLNVMVSMPYVITNASQGTLNGQHGIQDLSINVKGKYAEPKLGPGKLKIGGNIGLTTPISHYLIDFAPLNIGAGCTDLSYRQLFTYQFNNGFYAHLRASYTWRSNVPNIHRDFYYDQGSAYYTNEVDVPDLFDWAGALGYSGKKFLAEASYQSYSCTSGGDIRTWDPGFPSNKMNSTVIAARFQYFFTQDKTLFATATGGYTVAGRNVGQSAYAGIMLEYTFGAWGKKKSEN